MAMKYSCIYDFDIRRAASISDYRPSPMKNWHMTECCDSSDEYDYDGDGLRTKHRKYCGILEWDEFEKFVKDSHLDGSIEPTMGSLGAPGFGIGWAPALAFMHDNYKQDVYWASVWVTPWDDAWGDDTQITDEMWDVMEETLREEFECRPRGGGWWLDAIQGWAFRGGYIFSCREGFLTGVPFDELHYNDDKEFVLQYVDKFIETGAVDANSVPNLEAFAPRAWYRLQEKAGQIKMEGISDGC